jgi:hypothetical protein
VFVGIEPDVVGLAHEAMEELGNFGDPLDIADAGGFPGGFAGQLVTFPDGDEVAGFAEEQDLALPLVVGVGEDEEDGFLLFDAGQVEEVGIGDGSEGAVGVGGGDVVGIDDRDGAGGRRRISRRRLAMNNCGSMGAWRMGAVCREAGKVKREA